MPEISRFRGIVVRMYSCEHPPPHFHAQYAEYRVTVDIHSGVVEGRFPPRALRLVLVWYRRHRFELLANWRLLAERKEPRRIPPLP
ncbi:MAG TPA: DUF4160 domain-containing protein [Planctomycetota bacterium]